MHIYFSAKGPARESTTNKAFNAVRNVTERKTSHCSRKAPCRERPRVFRKRKSSLSCNREAARHEAPNEGDRFLPIDADSTTSRIYRQRREIHDSPAKRTRYNRRPLAVNVDDFDRGVILRKMLEIYEQRKYPTLDTTLCRLEGQRRISWRSKHSIEIAEVHGRPLP